MLITKRDTDSIVNHLRVLLTTTKEHLCGGPMNNELTTLCLELEDIKADFNRTFLKLMTFKVDENVFHLDCDLNEIWIYNKNYDLINHYMAI